MEEDNHTHTHDLPQSFSSNVHETGGEKGNNTKLVSLFESVFDGVGVSSGVDLLSDDQLQKVGMSLEIPVVHKLAGSNERAERERDETSSEISDSNENVELENFVRFRESVSIIDRPSLNDSIYGSIERFDFTEMSSSDKEIADEETTNIGFSDYTLVKAHLHHNSKTFVYEKRSPSSQAVFYSLFVALSISLLVAGSTMMRLVNENSPNSQHIPQHVRQGLFRSILMKSSYMIGLVVQLLLWKWTRVTNLIVLMAFNTFDLVRAYKVAKTKLKARESLPTKEAFEILKANNLSLRNSRILEHQQLLAQNLLKLEPQELRQTLVDMGKKDQGNLKETPELVSELMSCICIEVESALIDAEMGRAVHLKELTEPAARIARGVYQESIKQTRRMWAIYYRHYEQRGFREKPRGVWYARWYELCKFMLAETYQAWKENQEDPRLGFYQYLVCFSTLHSLVS